MANRVGATVSGSLLRSMVRSADRSTADAMPDSFEGRARQQLTKTQLPLIIGQATDGREQRRRAAFAALDGPGLRRAAEAVRAHTVVNLADYLERFAAAAEGKGTKIFFAG